MRVRIVSDQQTAWQAIGRWRAMRRVVAVLGIGLLILQLALPSMGRATAGGEWMVICGEFGAAEMFVPTEEEPVRGAEFSECENCTLCATGCGLDTPAGGAVFTANMQILPIGWSRPGEVAGNPAQFWSSNRGPPLGAGKITSCYGRKPLVSSINIGVVPCS